MDKISELEKFSWIFQFFGLQNFPLNNTEMFTKSKYPSKAYFVIILLWIIFAVTFVWRYLRKHSSVDFSEESIMFRAVFFVGLLNHFSTIFITIIFTLWDHLMLIEFFMKFQEVLRLFRNDIKCEVNLKEIRKRLTISYVVLLSSSLSFLFEIVYFQRPEKTVLILLSKIFAQIIMLRFNFYVQLINILIDTLRIAIDEKFGSEVQGKIHKEVWKTRSQFTNQHKIIVKMREIYKTIREMSDIVNKTMGFIILIQIIEMSLEMIKFVFLIQNFSWKNFNLYSKICHEIF